MYWISPDVLNTHYTGWFYVHIKSTNGNILVFFLFNCEFMHFWCHTIHCSPVCGKPKKTYLVFVAFPQKMWLFYMEWPSKNSCNYKVTMIIYFLALYSEMKDGKFLWIEILSFRYIWYNLSLLLSVNVKVEWLPANITAKVTLLISTGKKACE